MTMKRIIKPWWWNLVPIIVTHEVKEEFRRHARWHRKIAYIIDTERFAYWPIWYAWLGWTMLRVLEVIGRVLPRSKRDIEGFPHTGVKGFVWRLHSAILNLNRTPTITVIYEE